MCADFAQTCTKLDCKLLLPVVNAAAGVCEVGLVNDVIAPEHGGRLPSSDFHYDIFCDAQPPHIASAGSTQVVKEEAGASGAFTGYCLCLPKIAGGTSTEASEHQIIRSLFLHAHGNDLVNALCHFDSPAAPILGFSGIQVDSPVAEVNL